MLSLNTNIHIPNNIRAIRFGGLVLSSKAILNDSKKLIIKSLLIISLGLQENNKKQSL